MPIPRGPQAFPRSEFLRRHAAVKVEMAHRDLIALFISDPSNITYLTGYTTPSGYVPQGLVVTMADEEPTLVLRAMDAPAGVHQSFMDRDKVIAYPESLIGRTDRSGCDVVVQTLRDLGVVTGGIGLELSNLSAQAADRFRSALSEARVRDFTDVVTWLRIVKSDLEVEVLREAAAITDAAMTCASEVIRPGAHEANAVAEICRTLVRGVDGKPGGRIPDIALCSSPRTGTAHIPWSDDVFRQGSQVNLELAGVRHAYAAPLMRTFSVGAPCERLLRVHDAHMAGMDAALATIRPGATCGDVANAFHRTYEKQGIGWLEPTASFQEGDMTVLKPNMTFHLMLGNWFDEDFGYMISETIRVTEGGVEELTNTPRKLFVL
ncbi:M24 family metallopeptidase [Mesorhizobium sp. B4-1-4]|uniref:M24 family metallopeptidase n=1 Tax=Mesorhizobium sp. B4-1-4 TaxID=2589888 RepID=UPI00112C9CD8|nr:Xaa-Pro peptidase family protein [Mesorhizobium sp. B4-1-4]UCI31897.1 Xaa-Pro peptidase family protein [Mesorhizobium sp. B4-1-4]